MFRRPCIANEIEQIAGQNGVAVEFVSWFFNEKKASCGNVSFMMMAAMWEGWKGRDSESTAALATIEKCREIVGCPEGVDLQDHLRHLAAENVGLKKFIQTECFVEHIEPETFYEEEVTRYVSADGYEPETPATDSIYAGVKADGVESFAKSRRELAKETTSKIMPLALEAEALRAEDFAQQLREGPNDRANHSRHVLRLPYVLVRQTGFSCCVRRYPRVAVR